METAPRDEGRYLLLLKETADAVARAESPEDALDATVTLVAQRLGFDVCSIYLLDERGELVLTATHGLRKESIGKVRMSLREGLTGLVAETERPFFTSRADEHPRFKFFPETGEERFLSFGGVPLMRRGRLTGVLTVQTIRAAEFHANEVVVLQTLAGQVVSLVEVTRAKPATADGTTSGEGAIPGRAPKARGLLQGLGTSPGIGIGRAVLLGVDPTRAPPPPRAFEGEGPELARFEAARTSAVRALDALATQLERERGASAALIFRAHEELIQDPALEERVRARIGEREPVERAVHAAIEDLAAVFRGKTALREKVHDLEDVRVELLRALGVPGRADRAREPGGRDGGGAAWGEKVVVVASVLTPAETAHLDPTHVVAIVTEHGSQTSHASILARSLGIPAVVAVPGVSGRIAPGERLLVDGENGFIFEDPDPETEGEYARRGEAARAATRAIASELEKRAARGPLVPNVALMANVGLPVELGKAREQGADGIGLLRTEFFFLQQSGWPRVEAQVAFYRQAFRLAPKGPIVVRLLDAGGDKELPWVEPRHEPNPILGLRSVRFLLAHPEPCRAQVAALVQAAAAERADVRLLVPMVTTGWELTAFRQLIEEASTAAGVPPLPLGMMVEAPSVLYMLDDLVPLADFVSVGTNDLTQYLLAVDRDNELVRHYLSPYHPAVVRALAGLQSTLAQRGLSASICGEMAGDPLGALGLLALGYRSLSVRPRAIPALRCLVHCVAEASLPGLRAQLVAASTADEVERLLRRALREAAPFLLEV